MLFRSGVVADIQGAQFGEDLQPFANTLERIAAAEPKEWLPSYWGAFCYMMKSFTEPVVEKKDQYLEKAEKLVTTADELNPNNDEVEVLKANIASARMAVDPMNRWQKYVPISSAAIAKAKALNPLNPRLGPYLKGFRRILVPEMNNGQLVRILRAEFLVDAEGLNKIQGKPFKVSELCQAIAERAPRGSK